MDELKDFEITDLLDGDSSELEFDIKEFDFLGEEIVTTRHTKPKFKKLSKKVCFKNAKNLVDEVDVKIGEEQHFIVQGDFIMGDFIEALLVKKQMRAENLIITTLSLSQNNVDSLCNLMKNGYVGNLTLMISNYFYSHEKKKLIPYLIENLDIDNRLDLLVVRNHTKITLMEIDNLRVVISGSGNMRSSNCVEQLIIQENEALYDFYKKWINDYQSYSIINKEIK